VRNALIIVDEPELHLHPKWQKALLDIFIRLAETTGNHFLLATHSPTFISPKSIRFVSRVYSENQSSCVVRLDGHALPDIKHLLSMVNSQNNERIFFADEVVLVEGISDRIVFEKIFAKIGEGVVTGRTIEIVSVGGKGLFAAYRDLLGACAIAFKLIADLDYIAEVGTPAVKQLMTTNAAKIKSDVIDNVKSKDGDSLVKLINSAFQSESWEEASELWQYIKSTRLTPMADLSEAQQSILDEFLSSMRDRGILILSKGALEAYLPEGFAGKNISKLVEFLDSANFMDLLPPAGKDELLLIAKSVGIVAPSAASSGTPASAEAGEVRSLVHVG
jgi:putative ATP-dependent endonuclease of the OLD family